MMNKKIYKRSRMTEEKLSADSFTKERKKESGMEKWKHYLSIEVGIEYKACLYFFCFLFYYAMYRVLRGIYTADLLHMAEMIGTTYAMGYLQVFALGNFDESDRYLLREFLLSLLCTAIYTGAGFVFGWFDRRLLPTVFFAAYCILAYAGACLVNRLKREIDTQQLNVMLQGYQRGRRRFSDLEKEACGMKNADGKEQNEKGD